MNKRLRVIEIIIAGCIAATLSACISSLSGGCVRTPGGGYQCSGGYEPENQVTPTASAVPSLPIG